MLTTLLFDLDGTLLPMDQDQFTHAYFGLLARKVAPLGYDDPQQLVKAVWQGTAAMVRNDGSKPNMDAFWDCFCGIYGERARQDIPVFNDFYQNEFQQAQTSCGFNPTAKETVDTLRAMGLRVALATNPIFPAVATQSRVRWAGLVPEDFEWITTYENSVHCKPNPAYFTDVAAAMSVDPADCLMVGNDVEEDMVAATAAGMRTFLLTDCLLNPKTRDVNQWPHGSFDALTAYVREIVGVMS